MVTHATWSHLPAKAMRLMREVVQGILQVLGMLPLVLLTQLVQQYKRLAHHLEKSEERGRGAEE